MRDYTQESIESKYRADLEKLGSYSIIIPLDKGDIGCYVEGFDDTSIRFETIEDVTKFIQVTEKNIIR